MIARTLRLGALLVACLVLVVAIRELQVDSSGGSGRQSDLDPGITVYEPSERQPHPILEGTTLTGSVLSTIDLNADILVVNVWGSWCPPCRAEMPALVRLANRQQGRGVLVLGINTRDGLAAAKAFVRRFDVPFPSLIDEGGVLTLALRDIIPANAVPSTLIVDRDGLVAARVVGPITEITLRDLVEDVLQESSR